MECIPTEIEDVLLLKPSLFKDERGFFFESYRRSHLKNQGLDLHFVQDNVSKSTRHTLRGLHYQIGNTQAKLMMVFEGEILDVAVDLRRSSTTFGQHVSCVLSAKNKHQLLVPKGFAHGFLVRSDHALVYYKCSDYYNKEGERGLKWDDPALQIDWNINTPVLSEKDQEHPLLKDISDRDLFD